MRVHIRRIWLVLLFWWSRYEYSHRQLLLLLNDLCSAQLTCAFWVLGGGFLIGCQGLEPIPDLKACASKNVVILEATVFVWRQTTQLVTFREQGTRFWKWSSDKIIEHRTDTCAHLWYINATRFSVAERHSVKKVTRHRELSCNWLHMGSKCILGLISFCTVDRSYSHMAMKTAFDIVR